MRAFPERTETDLYLYVMDNLHYLREQYGPAAPEAEQAVEDLKRTQAGKGSLIGLLKRRGDRDSENGSGSSGVAD